MWKRLAATLAACLVASAAFAQSASNSQPVVVNGTDANGGLTTCIVGTVATGTCPLPTSATSSAAATTNSAGTITLGGTFQQLTAASTTRQSVDFQNLSGNGDACYIFFGSGAATTGASIKVADQQEYIRSSGVVPSDKIQITCTTTSDAFYAAVQ